MLPPSTLIPEVEVRAGLRARMQRSTLTEDRVSLSEILDDQRLHDPGGALAFTLGQPRPGLEQPGPAVSRIAGSRAATTPGHSPGVPRQAAVRGAPRPARGSPAGVSGRARTGARTSSSASTRALGAPRGSRGGQARVVLLGGADALAAHVGVHRASQVDPLGVRRLLEDGAPAVGDRRHRQPVGRRGESLGVAVEQAACREAVVVDPWDGRPVSVRPPGVPEPGARRGPSPTPGSPARRPRVGHLGEPALVEGLEVVRVRRRVHGFPRGRAGLGISA